MKKLVLILFLTAFLFGCSTTGPSSTWKNWDHFKFSAWGHKNVTCEEVKQSDQEGWWGEPVGDDCD